MPIVTGILADFTRQSFLQLQPVIRFHPSGPAVRATSDGVLYASRVIDVVPSTSTWQVDLEQTGVLRPETWYNVSVRWLDAGGNYIQEDFLPGRLYVPAEGGTFVNLYRTAANPLEAWVSPGAVIPPEASPQDFLFDPITSILYQVA